MELTEMNNGVLSHLDENFDLKEIYVYITFYFDGKVEFNGIGLDKGMQYKQGPRNDFYLGWHD